MTRKIPGQYYMFVLCFTRVFIDPNKFSMSTISGCAVVDQYLRCIFSIIFKFSVIDRIELNALWFCAYSDKFNEFCDPYNIDKPRLKFAKNIPHVQCRFRKNVYRSTLTLSIFTSHRWKRLSAESNINYVPFGRWYCIYFLRNQGDEYRCKSASISLNCPTVTYNVRGEGGRMGKGGNRF